MVTQASSTCMVGKNSRLQEGKQVSSINPVFTQWRYSKPPLSDREGWEHSPNPKFPDASQGQALLLVSRVFKDSDFGPALLTLFCTDTNPFSKSKPHIKVATSNSFVYLIIFKGFFRRWHYKSSRSEILHSRLKMAWLFLTFFQSIFFLILSDSYIKLPLIFLTQNSSGCTV